MSDLCCKSCKHFRLVKDFKNPSQLSKNDATCIHPDNFCNIVYLTTADSTCYRHEARDGQS